jgi:hypothetical protein
MTPQARTYVLNMVLAFVPDLFVCWMAMRLTDPPPWTVFCVTGVT